MLNWEGWILLDVEGTRRWEWREGEEFKGKEEMDGINDQWSRYEGEDEEEEMEEVVTSTGLLCPIPI